jgi:hypothetical protein
MADPIRIYSNFSSTNNLIEASTTGNWSGSQNEVGTSNGGSWNVNTWSSNSKIEVSSIPYNGLKIYIGGKSTSAQDGVIFEVKDVSGSKMISLSLVNSNITGANIAADQLVSYVNEAPWPSKFSNTVKQKFQLSAATGGYQVSIYSGGSWIQIISLPFKDAATNYLNSPSINTYFKTTTNWCGIKMPSGSLCLFSDLDVYKVSSFGNCPPASYFLNNYPMFYDDFNHSSNPYNPNNATFNSSPSPYKAATNNFYKAGSGVANFATNGSSLIFSTTTYSELLSKGTPAIYTDAASFPTSNDVPLHAIKFIYNSGDFALDINDGVTANASAFSIFFNSTVSGTLYPVTVRTYVSDGAKNPTFNPSYDTVGSAPGTASVPNTSGTSISNGSTVWVVSYPKVSGYPFTVSEYKVAIYVQSSQPTYTSIPTLRTTVSYSKRFFNTIGFFTRAGASAVIDDLGVYSLDIQNFGNPSSSTVNTTIPVNYGIPSNIAVSANQDPLTGLYEADVELSASAYLGNDLVYNTNEVIS